MMQQVLGEIPSISVEKYVKHHLVKVVSELYHVDVIKEMG